jgi:hypothetical protein
VAEGATNLELDQELEAFMKIVGRLAVLAAAALVQGALAAETAYDFVVCTHGKPSVMLEASGDITGYSVEGWGVVATSKTKEWDNASTHCVGYMRWIEGRPIGKGLCKWTQMTGDSAVGEWEYLPGGQRRYTWLVGSGRLKGIAGSGSFEEMPQAQTVDKGTSQGCRHDWGSYSVAP